MMSLGNRAANLSLSVRNFNGRLLRVAVVGAWPSFGIRRTPAGDLVPDGGLDVSILDALVDKLNFTYRLLTPKDGMWGQPYDNGTVTGIIGMVFRSEVDFAINYITITAERQQVVDFTDPYYVESSKLLSRAPSVVKSPFAVFLPFTSSVWTSIAAATVVTSLFICLFALLANIIFGKNYLSKWESSITLLKARPPLGCQEIFFTSYRLLIDQGDTIRCNKWIFRHVLLAWLMVCIIIQALYSGTLTAVLTFPAHENVIDSLEDLLRAAQRKEYYPCVARETSYHSILKNANSGIYAELYKTLHPELSYVQTPVEGFKRVLEKNIVYFSSDFAIEVRIIMLGISHFHISKDQFYVQSYGVACQKGSTLKQIFDPWLNRFAETGLVIKWKKDQLLRAATMRAKETVEQTRNTNGLEPMSLRELQGAFFVYFIGAAIGVVVLLLEILFSKNMTSCLETH